MDFDTFKDELAKGVQERLEAFRHINEFESHLADKIPSGGFFSFRKTDIVEDKCFEKETDFELKSDNILVLIISMKL